MSAKPQQQTIDNYIKPFPKNIRSILNTLRKTIRSVVPKAEETISYQVPAFKLYGKVLLWFAAWKHHVAMYPVPSGDGQFKKELSLYRTGKGTVQFALEKPLPLKFIRKFVQNRVKEHLKRFVRGAK